LEEALLKKIPALALLSFSTMVVCIPAAFTQIISFDLMLDLNSFGSNGYTWAFPIFVAGECASMALSAGFIDRYGRRGPFLIGSALFVAATCGAAYSTEMNWFILFRLIQGLGTGIVIVTCLAQVYFEIKDKKDRYLSNGILSFGFGVGMILGLFISKAVAGTWGWTNAFWFLAALQATLTFPVMDVMKNGKKSEMKADKLGSVILAVLVASFILFLQKFYLDWDIHSVECHVAILFMVALLIAFIFVETYSPHSMYHRRVDSGKFVTATMLFIVLLGIFLMGAVGYMVKTAFFTYQMSVHEAAPFFTIMILGSATTAIALSHTIDRTGHLPWIILCIVLTPIALLSMLLVTPDDPSFLFAVHLFLLGLAIGCLVSMLNATIQNRSNKDNNGVLISFAIMARTTALWIGFNFYLLWTDLHMTERIGDSIEHWNDVLNITLPDSTSLASMLLTPVGDLIRLLPGLTEDISIIYGEGIGIGFTYGAIIFVIIAIPTALLLIGRRKLL